MSIIQAYLLLAFAIGCEVVATSLIPATQGFTRPLPTIAAIAGYIVAIFTLSLVAKVLPLGIVYALWAGLGIVLIAAVGWLVLGQRLDVWAMIGIALILAGVVVINTLSKSVAH